MYILYIYIHAATIYPSIQTLAYVRTLHAPRVWQTNIAGTAGVAACVTKSRFIKGKGQVHPPGLSSLKRAATRGFARDVLQMGVNLTIPKRQWPD